ncbi:MAG: Beta-galactosidase, family [Verrucomicrobiota bacterium]|jgi:beta-galactosidase
MHMKHQSCDPCRLRARAQRGAPARHLHARCAESWDHCARALGLAAATVALALLLLPAPASAAEPTSSPRLHLNWDDGWRFHLGDPAGADATSFDDTRWEPVLLPHDWAILGPISKDNPGIGRMGYYGGGVGWYRKSFTLPAGAEGKRVRVTFDGVYMNADVWINGHALGRRPYGYVSFDHDLTPWLHGDGRPNVIAVRVDNSVQPSSRWYTGCGIYRHVWLTATADVHVAPDGVFVTTPTVTGDRATVRVEASVANAGRDTAAITVAHTIRRDGRVVAQLPPQSQPIRAGATARFDQSVDLPRPALWSPDSPALYSVETSVSAAGRIVDSLATRFGVRRLEFTADQGFSLNGRNLKLKGVCLHHDAGPVGAAVPEDVLRRRLLLLQAAGCNAIRTGHAPMAPEFYDLCDELGLLVMAETLDEWRVAKRDMQAAGYNTLFAGWAVRDVEDAVRRDRNHPSIFMWSVGNEVREISTAEAVADARGLVEAVHRLDPSRPVTSGTSFMAEANRSGFADAFDVAGYNDGGGGVFLYDEDRLKYPGRKFIGTEHPHTGHTRGVYHTTTRMREAVPGHSPGPDLAPQEVFPETKELVPDRPVTRSSYDNDSIYLNSRDSWRLTASRPYVMGEFRWTGIDYLGESRWPARATPSGLLDLAGFPKDQYYLYQSFWTKRPMVHLLPHWTHPGKEGVAIPVVAYSNAEEVELFQDGRSLGRQPMTLDWQIVWQVPYRPGVLRAVAYRDGRVVAETTQRTAGPARRLQLEVDRATLTANRRDAVHATVSVVDEHGVLVPAAANRITFSVRGPLRLLGTENGNVLDHTPAPAAARDAFMGLCLAIYQATDQTGPVEVTVSAEGLEPATVRLNAQPLHP